MDEKELTELTRRYEKVTKKESKVTLPPGADGVDIAEYLRLAKGAKALLAKAHACGDGVAAGKLSEYVSELKRVARGRAIQRELARFEGRTVPRLTDFPALDPGLQNPRR